MDSTSQRLPLESSYSAEHLEHGNGLSHHLSHLEAQCLVCRRAFSLEAEVNEGFEAICICRECKIMVLDGNQTGLAIRDIRRRTRHGSRARSGSSEPREESFSRRFSQLINLASQTNEAHLESGAHVSMRQHQRNIVAHNRSQRRQRVSSDNESDGPDHLESLFGDTDSNISFSSYGGDSDASVDRYSSLDVGTFHQLEHESDSDIDPMHAGLDQWDSDYQDDEDVDWEEAALDATTAYSEIDRQFQDATSGLDGTGGRNSQDSAWVHWRTSEVDDEHYSDIFADLEEVRQGYVGHPTDYVDASGFEELLEQLAVADSSRRGPPPAAKSYVRDLPCIIISKDHDKNGPLICAVCKDLLMANMEAKQLPCRHLYHSSCILPWLNTRNSCPVCRYELPTDDAEYEETKRYRSRTQTRETPHVYLDEENNDMSSESEADNAHAHGHARVQHGSSEDADNAAERSTGEDSRGGWLLLAAAPIVSIVGIVLVLWLGKPVGDRRIRRNIQEQHFNRSQSAPSGDRNRRWWFIF